MNQNIFIQQYTIDLARSIVADAPEEANKFIYAYATRTVDYVKDDGMEWRVFHNKSWKIVAPFIAHAFKDMAFDLNELRDAIADYEKAGTVDLDGMEILFWREKGREVAEKEILAAVSGCVLSRPMQDMDMAKLFKILDAHEQIELYGGMKNVRAMLKSSVRIASISLTERLKESLEIYKACSQPAEVNQ